MWVRAVVELVDGALILVIIDGMDLSIAPETEKSSEKAKPMADIHSYGGHSQQ